MYIFFASKNIGSFTSNKITSWPNHYTKRNLEIAAKNLANPCT